MTIISPCISVCILDEERGVCRGCARTLDEIGDWSRYHATERERIMAELPARRAALDKEQD